MVAREGSPGGPGGSSSGASDDPAVENPGHQRRGDPPEGSSLGGELADASDRPLFAGVGLEQLTVEPPTDRRRRAELEPLRPFRREGGLGPPADQAPFVLAHAVDDATHERGFGRVTVTGAVGRDELASVTADQALELGRDDDVPGNRSRLAATSQPARDLVMHSSAASRPGPECVNDFETLWFRNLK